MRHMFHMPPFMSGPGCRLLEFDIIIRREVGENSFHFLTQTDTNQEVYMERDNRV